jgi:hypothetical protein
VLVFHLLSLESEATAKAKGTVAFSRRSAQT